MIKIEIIDSEEGFKNLQKDWDDLLLKSHGSIFQSWKWLFTWWQYYEEGKYLSLLIFKEGNKLIGLAPFFISSTYLGLPLKKYSFLGTGPSDYGDFLVLPETRKEYFIVLEEFLKKDNAWDIVDLEQINENSPNLPYLENLIKNIGGKKIFQEKSVQLELPKNYEELLAGLSKKFSWNINYYNRRLKRDYQFEIKKITKDDNIEKWMKTFFNLHQKRWLKKKTPTLLLIPKFQKFHQEVAKFFSQDDCLELYFLILNEKIVASLYGFKSGNCFYNYLGGFDPAFGRLSVATVLTSQIIKECIEENLDTFDFLRGEEEYKFKWGGKSINHFRFIITKNKKGNLIKKFIEGEQKIKTKVKQKLQK